MKRNIVLFSLCLSCSLRISSLSAQSDYPYKNPKLPIEQRVNDLLGRMTLEEKVAQLNMKSLEYKNLHIEEADEEIKVTCELANTGKRDGAEVVQLYVRDMVSSTSTPLKALKAFQKVFLQAGETKTIRLMVKKEDLKVWNPEMQKVLEPGEFKVMIGASAEDIRLEGRFEIL